MNSKKVTHNKRLYYILSHGDSFYTVTEGDMKKLSRQHALSICAVTWLSLHRILRVNAIMCEDLYISKGKVKIKIIDGMMNALSKLNILHPSLINQIRQLDLSHGGFRVYDC